MVESDTILSNQYRMTEIPRRYIQNFLLFSSVVEKFCERVIYGFTINLLYFFSNGRNKDSKTDYIGIYFVQLVMEVLISYRDHAKIKNQNEHSPESLKIWQKCPLYRPKGLKAFTIYVGYESQKIISPSADIILRNNYIILRNMKLSLPQSSENAPKAKTPVEN